MKCFPLKKKNGDPFLAEFDFGKAFDSLLNTPFTFGLARIEAAPAIDVYEKGDKLIAEAEIPGAKPEDLKLSVERNLLTITGEKKESEETKKKNYYHRESSYGAFQRVVELPSEVKGEEAKATYKNGVLKVELPKAESAKKKEIKINIE
ncbi:MAG: hypothetical protein A2Z72_07260 [Omnitrophica bacterium RBG_13_46_9]|nr:MAG: hypothetical protein A2Z72_07260 [Omnitrophica bacterium RBG_13_46_9]